MATSKYNFNFITLPNTSKYNFNFTKLNTSLLNTSLFNTLDNAIGNIFAINSINSNLNITLDTVGNIFVVNNSLNTSIAITLDNSVGSFLGDNNLLSTLIAISEDAIGFFINNSKIALSKPIKIIAYNTLTNGEWVSNCTSTNRIGSYAKFYTFNINKEKKIVITLSSIEDTFLFLLAGKGSSGAVLHKNDDFDGTNSQITVTLSAGDYTIEVTTYYSETIGSFELNVATDDCFWEGLHNTISNCSDINLLLNLASIKYVNKSLSMFPMLRVDEGFWISNDGRKLIACDGESLFEYVFAIPWDITTLTYTSIKVNIVHFWVIGFCISHDGKFLYAADDDKNIYQYSFSIPWDISTLTDDNLWINTGLYSIQEPDISVDGTRISIWDRNTERYLVYSLIVPYSLEKYSLISNEAITGYFQPFSNRTFPGGKQFAILSQGTSIMHVENLNNVWNFNSRTNFVSSFDFSNQVNSLDDIFIRQDFTEIYIRNNNTIFKYTT